MAEMIPEFMPDGASNGERRVFAALQSLPDDVIVYYEPVIRRRYPDFIVIAPSIGVIVIEVKGIPLKTITHVDSHHIAYTHAGNPQQQSHPSRQARGYMNRLMALCADNPAASDLKHNGHFAFAFGQLAIMTSLDRHELDASPWAALFPRGSTLCADEFDVVSTAPAALMAALKAAIYPEIPITPIPPERIRTLRTIVSPPSRIETGSLFGDEPPRTVSVDVLDYEQEKVARQLGSGHRILYGVPGSGKTVVLTAAARLLAEAGMSVLMLCYNRTLQGYLAKTLKKHTKVDVHTFGIWGSMQGAPRELTDREIFGQGVLSIIESGGGDSGKYDAVLIDEGQDFSASWFQSAVLALKEPADGTLIIAYDVSQNLYRAKLPNWSKVGVKAKGRTRKFPRNYRNTREIVAAAASFGELDSALDDDMPHTVALRRENCVRSGEWPSVIQAPNLDAQVSRCMSIIRELQGDSPPVSARDIMVLCKRNALRDRIASDLEKRGLSATVSTIHGARGLQARSVILLAADELQDVEDRPLMYVALTRPTDRLFVLWSHDTPFVKELLGNLERARTA